MSQAATEYGCGFLDGCGGASPGRYVSAPSAPCRLQAQCPPVTFCAGVSSQTASPRPQGQAPVGAGPALPGTCLSCARRHRVASRSAARANGRRRAHRGNFTRGVVTTAACPVGPASRVRGGITSWALGTTTARAAGDALNRLCRVSSRGSAWGVEGILRDSASRGATRRSSASTPGPDHTQPDSFVLPVQTASRSVAQVPVRVGVRERECCLLRLLAAVPALTAERDARVLRAGSSFRPTHPRQLVLFFFLLTGLHIPAGEGGRECSGAEDEAEKEPLLREVEPPPEEVYDPKTRAIPAGAAGAASLPARGYALLLVTVTAAAVAWAASRAD